jgi:hypothetical protein
VGRGRRRAPRRDRPRGDRRRQGRGQVRAGQPGARPRRGAGRRVPDGERVVAG